VLFVAHFRTDISPVYHMVSAVGKVLAALGASGAAVGCLVSCQQLSSANAAASAIHESLGCKD
jgi:hypothetical protein